MPPPILSLQALAWKIKVPLARLHKIAGNVDKHYDELRLLKGDKLRILHVPHEELKEIQRRICKHILEPISLGDEVHGGVRGRSTLTNAARHLGKPCVVCLDVKSFFPSVRHAVVYRMFRAELGFGRDVASMLTRLTTLQAQLPQGAPTSTAVANLILPRPVDRPMAALAQETGVVYGRFVDDICMSGDNPRPLISEVAKALSRRRLPMYRAKVRSRATNKLRVMPSSGPQLVTGLNVNDRSGPSVPRGKRDKVRAAIHSLRSIETEAARSIELRSIRGRIAYIRQFNPGEAIRLERSLAETLAHCAAR